VRRRWRLEKGLRGYGGGWRVRGAEAVSMVGLMERRGGERWEEVYLTNLEVLSEVSVS